MTDKIMTKEEFERMFRGRFRECSGITFITTYIESKYGGYTLDILLEDGTRIPVTKICNAGKSLATDVFMMGRSKADFKEMEIRIE